MSAGPSMQGTVPLQGLSSQHQCEGVYKDVLLGYDNNPSDPMLLLLDNSDSSLYSGAVIIKDLVQLIIPLLMIAPSS